MDTARARTLDELPRAPAEGTLRLAHFSDPHLTTLAGVRPGRLRDKRLFGWLSWRRRRRFRHRPEILERLTRAIGDAAVDHRVVTGDLTHIGLPEELEEARVWLASLGEPTDTTLVPGNHDLYVADAQHTMRRIWAPWMRGDDGGDFPFLRLRGPVALVGLDSAAPSPFGFASGRLGDAQLRAAEDVLVRAGAAGYARVVLVHHAPQPGGDPYRKRLLDAAALTDLLRRTGAELVLHGHGHRARVRPIDTARGPLPVVQAPSASSSAGDGAHRAAWMACTVEATTERFALRVTARTLDGTDGETHAFSFPRAS